MDAFDREVQAIEKACFDGLITSTECDEEIRELERDRRDAAHEAAQEAYDDVLERW